MSPTRTRAERDAVTVEIMFALVTASFAGGIGFLLAASPALWTGLLPRPWEAPWTAASAVLGLAVFLARLLQVLRWQPARTRPGAGP
ncbi:MULTISPECIES: DUF6332 family protein [unclassified Streptomyces]|uniref:DUF6332 family protein n=1 Tax=unclassified Streptomyces TaxID=2593676 RepID=UPI0037F83A8A